MPNDHELDDQLGHMAKRSQERRASAVDIDTALHEHHGRLQAPGGSRRRQQRWLAGAAAVLVISAGIGAIALPRGREPDMVATQTVASSTPSSTTAPSDAQSPNSTVPMASPTSAPPASAPTTSQPPVPGPWSRTIDEPPLADRVYELVIATSDSVFVWGGFVPEHADGSVPPFADGAIVDLATGAWSPVAEGPLAGGWASGVWTGSEVVVANQGMVAAYDPALDTWRDLDVPAGLTTESVPYESHYLTIVDRDVVAPFAGLEWDIDQNTWREMTPAPSLLGYPRSKMIDGRLIVAGAPTESPTNPMVFAYDLESDDWLELPPPGWQVYSGDAIGFVGNQLVVVSSIMGTAGALDLVALEWRTLPSFPQSLKCHGELEPVDETQFVVSLCSLHAALTFGSDEWVLFDPPSTSRTFGLLATGDGLVIDGTLLDPTSVDWVRSP